MAATKDESTATTSVLFRASAPGRANVIGEHVDYMGGLVLPCAIGFTTSVDVSRLQPQQQSGETKPAVKSRWVFALRAADDEASSLVIDFESLEDLSAQVVQRTPAESLLPAVQHDWHRYVLGAVAFTAQHLEEEGPLAPIDSASLRFEISGNVPQGAGLSSSASLNVALVTAVVRALRPDDHSNGQLPAAVVAKIAQRIEHVCCGVKCGIMDPFISASGGCLLLDCDTLACSAVPLAAACAALGLQVVLVNSMVGHALADGSYNRLRSSLEAAEAALQAEGACDDGSTQPAAGKTLRLAPLFAELTRREVRNMRLISDTVDAAPLDSVPGIPQRLWDAYCAAHPVAFAKVRAAAGEAGVALTSYVAQESARTVLMHRLLELAVADHGPGRRPHAAPSLLVAEAMGRLLNATHAGLSGTLRVSTEELDLLQSLLCRPADHEEGGARDRAATAAPPAVGARMMGGGFGGCVLAFVPAATPAEAAARVRAAVSAPFRARFGLEPAVYAAEVSNVGAAIH